MNLILINSTWKVVLRNHIRKKLKINFGSKSQFKLSVFSRNTTKFNSITILYVNKLVQIANSILISTSHYFPIHFVICEQYKNYIKICSKNRHFNIFNIIFFLVRCCKFEGKYLEDFPKCIHFFIYDINIRRGWIKLKTRWTNHYTYNRVNQICIDEVEYIYSKKDDSALWNTIKLYYIFNWMTTKF